MAEPEELIVEGAYVTTRFARTIWRRYRVEIKEPTLLLRDARWRLELFVGALVGTPIRIAEAESPAPRSWLARFTRHGPALTRRHDATPGTDGMRLSLPASLPARDGIDAALEIYPLWRCSRPFGSCAAVPRWAFPPTPVRFEIDSSPRRQPSWIGGSWSRRRGSFPG